MSQRCFPCIDAHGEIRWDLDYLGHRYLDTVTAVVMHHEVEIIERPPSSEC